MFNPDFFDHPSLETLGEVDLESMRPRDRGFMEKVLTLAQVDPDIVRRVVIMRHKLNTGLKLTNAEAEELLEVLNSKGFYFTGLNLIGCTFGELRMKGAVIRGDLEMNYCTIHGDNLQNGMLVEGDNDQNGMTVGGYNLQEGMVVDGDNNQYGMTDTCRRYSRDAAR